MCPFQGQGEAPETGLPLTWAPGIPFKGAKGFYSQTSNRLTVPPTEPPCPG